MLRAEGREDLGHILGIKCYFAVTQECAKLVSDKTMVALRDREIGPCNGTEGTMRNMAVCRETDGLAVSFDAP